MSLKSRIIFHYGEGTTQVVELDEDLEYLLGRDETCDIVVEEKSVSRRHITITFRDESWRFLAVSKNNGIIINGHRVYEFQPEHGQKFHLGRVLGTFAAAGLDLDADDTDVTENAPGHPSGEGRPRAVDGVTEQPPSNQPIVTCPVCGSKVQIIDFTILEDLNCHACSAHLGRLAVRHLENAGIVSNVLLQSAPDKSTELIVGEYRIVKELGSGGMGKVFQAVDRSTLQKVAIKILFGHKGNEQAFARAFENEARALARIFHKNIVKIYRFGLHGDLPYIAMEFVDGLSLKSKIQGPSRIGIDECLEILRQVLIGLDHIHNASIIHNDIKPSNILVRSDNVIKLVDFGIVQIGRPLFSGKRDHISGTVGYLSPEVIQGEPVSPKSDLYALGITLYYMLTGTRPLRGKDATETLELHLEKPIPNPQNLRFMPHETVCILARLLAKEPIDRYASAAEVLDDLDAMELSHPLNRLTVSAGKVWK